MTWTPEDRKTYSRDDNSLDRDKYRASLKDEEWELFKGPAELIFGSTGKVGRPRKHSLRTIMDALLYKLVNGVQWRDLPKDFPPYSSIYHYFKKLRDNGSIEGILALYATIVRVHLGREEMPTCMVIDTQSAKNYLSGGPKGYDAGKKIKGRKRIVIADAATGTPFSVGVVTADVQDRDLAEEALLKLGDLLTDLSQDLGLGIDLELADVFAADETDGGGDAGNQSDANRRILAILADNGFKGVEQADRRAKKGLPPLKFVERDPGAEGFQVVPVRWKIERAIAWLSNRRQLSKEYDFKLESTQAWLALSALLTCIRSLLLPPKKAPA